MKLSRTLLAAFGVLSTVSVAAAEDFMITYHVERTPSKVLSLDECTDLLERQAKAAGYRVAVDRHAGQLGVVSGGPERGGSFIAHCIAVDEKTVSVIQGLDYAPAKGPVGAFADRAHDALMAVAKK